MVLLEKAQRYLAAGHAKQAITILQEASEQTPEDAAIYAMLAVALRADGQHSAANEAELAAIALGQRNALLLYNLGTLYMMTQRPAPAIHWYKLALKADPAMIATHQNLASVLELEGDKTEAAYHRDQAYRRQSIFVDDATAAVRTVLILCTAGTGNTPFDFLLPPARNRRIKWMMEYATPEQIEQLPLYHIVFNAIGDHDVSAASRDMVARFLATNHKPVINPPQLIAHTTRDQTPALLHDTDRVLVPHTVRLHGGADIAEQLAHNGIHPPLLLRPVGSHGGRGQQLFSTVEALATANNHDEELYVSTYYDYRSGDGYYRKYRMIFIDGQPYPYHLAISEHWQVHYVNADMLQQPWKRDEEQAFLAHPEQVLGAAGMKALRSIAQRIALDYFGIDFGIMADGRILVFEANATMLVHTEDFHPQLKFKNPYVQNIIAAFDALLLKRTTEHA